MSLYRREMSEEQVEITSQPLVSIGLPVYNGEAYVAEAIESVLQQTHSALELVVSDNGSSDATESICRRYADQDDRIRYYRSEQNRGASWNYNRTVELAGGKYFRWLAHDDMLARTLIEKSVDVLETNPEVVLCFTWTKDIDEDGRGIEIKRSTRKYADDDMSTRFFSLSLRYKHNCEEVFGLTRTDLLRRTPMIANYTDSDRTLLVRLALYGVFYEIPEPLFLHRLHDQSSVRTFPDGVARMAWFDPAKDKRPAYPHWYQTRDLFLASSSTPMPFSDRLSCYYAWLRLTIRRRRHLFAEIKMGARYYYTRFFSSNR